LSHPVGTEELRAKILSCIKKVLGSKNLAYPDSSHTREKFEELADAIMEVMEEY